MIGLNENLILNEYLLVKGLKCNKCCHSCGCRNLLIYKQLGDAYMHRHDITKQSLTSIHGVNPSVLIVLGRHAKRLTS